MVTAFRHALAIIGCACLLFAAAASAQHGPEHVTIWSGVYAADDATLGAARVEELCVKCHGRDLRGAEAPALTGQAFFDRWHDLTLLDPVSYIQTAMPRKHDAFVSSDAARAIVAFMLKESGVPAGRTAMSDDVDVLIRTAITRAPSTPEKP